MKSPTAPARRPAAAPKLSGRERFARAARCQPVDRPPVWLMRQAGRCLPEYRALKEKYTFLQLAQTPELAAEVTLQPVRRFGFDAAILFSDILVIPEAMGQKYSFRETGGIEMEFVIRTAADVKKLQVKPVAERLQYVAAALRLLRAELGTETALLGFSGAPWTLANFMLEGGSAKEFTRARELFYTEPKLFGQLMEKLSAAVVAYLKMQIACGVDAVQLFDTSGGLLGANSFEAASARWIRDIITELKSPVPVIVFSKGAHGNWPALAGTGANVLGVDWTVDLAAVKKLLPKKIAVQGNLDPAVLTSTPKVAAAETKRILTSMRGLPGHIFNLGHGVPPTAGLENIQAVVDTVRRFR